MLESETSIMIAALLLIGYMVCATRIILLILSDSPGEGCGDLQLGEKENARHVQTCRWYNRKYFCSLADLKSLGKHRNLCEPVFSFVHREHDTYPRVDTWLIATEDLLDDS